MNPVEDQLPPPPQPHRISTSCDSHPDEHFTGFCPSCLFERLSVLDKSASSSSAAATATAGRKSASSAIKSIFRSSNSSINNAAGERPSFRARPGSFLPELRRTKTFSSGRNDAAFGFAAGFEPQRKSCDVRARNSLHSLFHQASSSSRVPIGAGIDQVEGKLSNSNEIVIEFNEEGGGIEEAISNPNPKLSCEEQLGEIPISEELKPMKDHLDLDSRNKKAGGSFWSAASVLSKKLRSWTRKKKHSGGRTVEVSKKSNAGRSCRETQSEVADYGYGRRSCDTDPRFSLDVGRMSLDYGRISLDAARFSLDDPRYSFDEPRASWDAGRPSTFPRMPSMLSVVEDSHHIPLEEPRRSINLNSEEGLPVPGGAAQTKDYYEDSSSSSRRRKSLDRSSSMRKTAAAVVAEMDEMKPAPVEYPLRDDCSEEKKSKSWRSWNIWGMIVRRGTITNKDEEDDRYSRVNGVERSYSESWQDLGRDPRVGFNRNGFRSNSSVSWRNSYSIGGSLRKTSVEANGHAKKKSNEFVLERNRSARYSPNDDNGLLRFYLAPMKGSRRGAMAKAKPAAYSHTIARSMLRMY